MKVTVEGRAGVRSPAWRRKPRSAAGARATTIHAGVGRKAMEEAPALSPGGGHHEIDPEGVVIAEPGLNDFHVRRLGPFEPLVVDSPRLAGRGSERHGDP